MYWLERTSVLGLMVGVSVADKDPDMYVLGPSGSGSGTVSQSVPLIGILLSSSKKKKTLIPNCFVTQNFLHFEPFAFFLSL
jgi:hypothetical protein